MVYKLDEDTKKIVKAIIHADTKRKRRIQAGTYTEFDRCADAAICAAKEDIRLEGFDDGTRRYLINRICESLKNNIPWELLGETYCCRRLFYEYRKEFCYYVALHMGIIAGHGQQAKAVQNKTIRQSTMGV